MEIYDIVGWIGSAMVVVAYLLLSLNKIKPGIGYQVLNLVASALMAIGLYPKNAWFSFALQIVWGIIAIVAIVRLVREDRKR